MKMSRFAVFSFLKMFVIILYSLLYCSCIFYGLNSNTILSKTEISFLKVSLNGNVLIAGNPADMEYGYNNGFSIFDISNPAAPDFIGSYAPPLSMMNIKFVECYGNLVFCKTSNYFLVVDISAPANPQLVAALYAGGEISGFDFLEINGQYAYTICFDSEMDEVLGIIDITDISSLVFISKTEVSIDYYSDFYVNVEPYIIVSENRILCLNDNTVTVLDITDKTTPLVLETVDIDTYIPEAIAFKDDVLYICNGVNSYVPFSIYRQGSENKIGIVYLYSDSDKIIRIDNLLFLKHQQEDNYSFYDPVTADLKVYDISVPYNPYVAGYIGDGFVNLNDFDISGNIAVSATEDSLIINLVPEKF